MDDDYVCVFCSHVVAMVDHMDPETIYDVLFGIYGCGSRVGAFVDFLVLCAQRGLYLLIVMLLGCMGNMLPWKFLSSIG